MNTYIITYMRWNKCKRKTYSVVKFFISEGHVGKPDWSKLLLLKSLQNRFQRTIFHCHTIKKNSLQMRKIEVMIWQLSQETCFVTYKYSREFIPVRLVASLPAYCWTTTWKAQDKRSCLTKIEFPLQIPNNTHT